MKKTAKVILNPGREKSLLRHHLWVFSGAVKKVENITDNGCIVEVFSNSGEWLARGSYSKDSQISVRVWTFDEEQEINEAFFESKIAQALQYRQSLGLTALNSGLRLVAAEADGLPGLTVDKYNEFLIIQSGCSGVDLFRTDIINALRKVMPECQGIYERSDLSVRAKEGLEERCELCFGQMPPEQIIIKENQLNFAVDVLTGHKSGFYFDQRDNRALIGEIAKDKTVLNLFSYTGGFGVAAAVGGAQKVINVDSSQSALTLCAENMKLNHIADDKFENIEADVFSLLRKFRGEQRSFDLIVLDPPKLIESQKALPRGCRAYKDSALQAFHLLNHGGILLTFSCSGLLDADLFQKITFDAALDAKCDALIVKHLFQSSDHPVALNQPESGYLKGLMVYKK